MHGGGVRAGDLDSRRAQGIVVGSDFFFLALQNLRIPFSLDLATSPSPTAQVAEEHGPRFSAIGVSTTSSCDIRLRPLGPFPFKTHILFLIALERFNYSISATTATVFDLMAILDDTNK